jgi:SAM-dependent methyltransferase
MAYSTAYFTARESWRDWRIEAQSLIELARVMRGARVLEIGCGGGGLLRLLRERGARGVGVDSLDVALNLARERDLSGFQKPDRSELIRVGEDSALPLCDAAFDAIIAQHVVEHLPDVAVALREWKRVLRSPEPSEGKPGGRLALATPNALYPDPAHFADADHAHVFTPRELRDTVQRVGFVVESCYTIFPFLSRARLLHALGVIAHSPFRRAPYFASRGRTLLLSARKP